MEEWKHPHWDFDEETDIPLTCQWKEIVNPPKEYETLLIMEGHSAVEFSKGCLIEGKNKINSILHADVDLYEDVKNSTILCTSLCDDNAIIADAMNLILPWIKSARNVIIIKTVPLVYFRISNDIEDNHYIRALYTDSSKNKLNDIQILEQPNILNGIAAGVINYRDYNNMPASIFAYYLQTNISGLDVQSAEPIQILLKRLNIPCSRVFTTKLKSSNLYV